MRRSFPNRFGPVLLGAFALLVGAFPGAGPRASETILEYGAACVSAIGEIPAFKCLDGTIVPITVNGVEPRVYEPRMKCDRPSMLPYPDTTFGQCAPYSRVLNLSRGTTQISAFCRREYLRGKDDPRFDEIDIILHSVKTGSTCWFHAEGDGAAGIDGSRVPPPNEATPPPGAISALDFWYTPARTAAKDCGHCHDSDPAMYSPYIGQVWEHVPVDPFGWYANDIGEAFRAWEKPNSITTQSNTCIGCHRIGDQFTCSTGIHQSAGQIPTDGATALGLSYPLSHWMPVNNFHSKAFWDTVYAPSVAALAACCRNPDLPSCVITPITGRPAG
jgi:hypothetical protein